MKDALAKLMAAVEALTRHAPPASPAHELLAEAKAVSEPAASENEAAPPPPAETFDPGIPPEEPQAPESSEEHS